MSWSWVIPGEPVAKARARVFRNPHTGHAHGVTPERTRHWEAVAVEVLACHWDGPPLDVPVRLEIAAVFARPKRLMRQRDPSGRMPNPCRPDADNVAKALMDAVQRAGVVRDDSRVCQVAISKAYAAKDEGPRVEVRISTYDSSTPINFDEIPF